MEARSSTDSPLLTPLPFGERRGVGLGHGKTSMSHITLLTSPQTIARHVHLRYVTDRDPGITRRRSGAGFTYLHPSGRPIRDAAILDRIRGLVIPPAWTRAWICPNPSGHLQATGRDD